MLGRSKKPMSGRLQKCFSMNIEHKYCYDTRVNKMLKVESAKCDKKAPSPGLEFAG